MSVKLEVGKWYEHEFAKGRFLQLVDPLKGKDGRTIGMWNPEKPSDDWRSEPAYLSGPYHIEPGDVVKPKPAGDKCWEEMQQKTDCLWVNAGRVLNEDFNEILVLEINQLHGVKQAIFSKDGSSERNCPLSCLILVRKAEKAQPRNGNPWTSAVAPNFVSTPEPDRDTETWCTPVGGPNPATLPSPLGGEQTWPDVKPGALLDTLPMNMHTTEDELVARDSDYQVCRMGDALGCIENIELGIVNNADRERIRKIIPQIERKLTQLKGRL